jgi:hypothetical protein
MNLKKLKIKSRYIFAPAFAEAVNSKFEQLGIREYSLESWATEAGVGLTIVFENDKDRFIYELNGGYKLYNALVSEYISRSIGSPYMVREDSYESTD